MSDILPPGFGGIPFRISKAVRPGEVLLTGGESILDNSLFPMVRREELIVHFETYWLIRYGNGDPWWAGFGVRLHRLTRQRIDSSQSAVRLPRRR